ncbi:hypothetical protein S83_022318 [Arachis hypogaea]|nr:uncharacterized protein DS421_7g208180 [Arachis hypogaea]
MCCDDFMKLVFVDDDDDDENLLLLLLLLNEDVDEQVSFFVESFHFSSKYNGAGAPSIILQLLHVDIEEAIEIQEQEQDETDCDDFAMFVFSCFLVEIKEERERGRKKTVGSEMFSE